MYIGTYSNFLGKRPICKRKVRKSFQAIYESYRKFDAYTRTPEVQNKGHAYLNKPAGKGYRFV